MKISGLLREGQQGQLGRGVLADLRDWASAVKAEAGHDTFGGLSR